MSSAWVYDIEVYPNYFCVTFRNLEDVNLKEIFIVDAIRNDTDILKEFVKGKWLIGYNNHNYDNPVLNFILAKKPTSDEIKSFSNRLINAEDLYINPMFTPYLNSSLYKSIDLLRLLFAKMHWVGLKELEVTMKWRNVQEIPHYHDKFLSKQEKEEVLSYNDNDTLATHYLANKSIEDIKLRHKIKQEFNLDAYSKDGVKTGVTLLLKMYCQKTGLDEREVGKMRTFRPSIKLSDVISDKVNFKSKPFQDLLERLKNTTITETRGSLDDQVLYGGVMHVYGTGGIHSKDKSGIIIPKPGYRYLDADVTSLYPSILIEYGFKPEHVTNDFIDIYRFLRNERVAAKRAGKKLIAETYKLSLNGAYGNLISEYSWLYDPKAAMGVTLNGQLFLSMLSEALIDAGIQVDSLNTDGITALVHESQEEDYWRITKEWQEHTKLGLEFREYSKVARLNVNAYYAIYKDTPFNEGDAGKIKEKGDLATKIVLGKGFDKPIVKIAIRDYFTKGIPIEQTIMNHKDIYDFTMFQKVGKQFEVFWNNSKQQHINRYYASKKGAYLYKVKTNDLGKKSLSHMLKGVGVQIFNVYEEKEIKDYHIDYQYYIVEARKIINEIETNQTSMFE